MNVAVVGGGLAGLVAAYDLARAGIRTTVLERNSRWGGQIWTECRRGFLIEHGAEGYATGRSTGHDLCRELGMTGRLVSQVTRTSFERHADHLVAVPPGKAAELVGIQANREDFGQGITSLVGGMGELIDALRAAVTDESDLRLGTAARSIEPQPTGWAIVTSAGDILRADALVLAVPAAQASELLTPLFPDASAALATFCVVSSVTVSLAFERAAVRHPLEGAGFISTAGPQADGFRACVFASSQFPGRAAPGHVLLRAFFRPGPTCPLDAADARWVDLSVGILRPVLGVGGDPVGAWVARWPNALPRYAPDHDAQVRAAARRLSRGPAPLVLAGAAYRGAGVAGAIESARAAARDLLLAAKPQGVRALRIPPERGLLGESDSRPDGEIVRRVLDGEVELFGVLVERYRAEFARYAAALVGDPDRAADAMQEAFIRAYRSLASCRDLKRVKAWFFRILTNQCHDQRTRRRRETPLEGHDQPARGRADAQVLQGELREAIERALDRLTPEQREAFVLRHIDGKSYEEMAAVLGTGVDALKMRVYRARDALRQQLEHLHE